MKLRELLKMLQDTATKIKVAPAYLVGGCPRDKYMGRLDNVADIDISNGDKDISYLSQELYNELKKRFNVSIKTAEDGHTTIFMGNIKLDFSSNFVIPNINDVLTKMGIKNITNMQREIYSRDFTCNTLLMDLELKHIYDPTDYGFKDIQDKKIRTCLSPEITLTNSRNRVPRAIYLACKLDFDIDHGIIDYVKKHPDTIKISTPKSLNEKIGQAFTKNADKASYLLSKMGLWNYISITETIYPYYQKSLKNQIVNKVAYFQGGGKENEPEPKKRKYKTDKAILVQPRFKDPFYRNYDYVDCEGADGPPEHGPGAGHTGINNFDSIEDFLAARRNRLKNKYVADDSWIESKPAEKKSTAASVRNHLIKQAIDYPIDDQYNQQGQMIYIDEESYQPQKMVGPDGVSDLSSFPSFVGSTDFGTYPYAAEIGWEKTPLHEPDFEGKSDAELNIGRDYENDEEPADLSQEDMAELVNKYLTPAETDLFGLPDGNDPADLDADQTIQVENPYTGISDFSREMYSDESQTRAKTPIL